ncbi:PAS domain S-box protein [uncultured Flavobacterium sp.]|uniref:PAS domain S-box protein n=1 Tax=uncultured Flavobacterium sp. TaxID=165435 RepID=UPI0025D3238F|nr:PAS domain S-box protein [uncultured Flavobacterium sp.]
MNFQKKDINFLIIESNQSDLEAIKKQLKAAFPESLFFIAHSMVEANEFLDGTILLNIILIDASIFDGDKNLLEYACSNSDLPIILLCDFDKEEFCNGLLSDKILDYIVKENSSKNLLSKTIQNSICRHKLEKKLEESEEKFRSLFYSSPLPKFIYDIETLEVLDLNNAFLKKYGYTKEEILQLKAFQLIEPNDFQNAFQQLENVRQDSDFSESFLRTVTKTGKIIDIVTQSNAIEFNKRRARLVLITDVTEKLKTEKDSLLTEQRFKALVQDGSELISILDSKGHFIYISPNVERNYGIDPQEYIGVNAFDLLHPGDAPFFISEFSKLKLKKRLTTKPFRYIYVEGKWRWLEASIIDMTDNAAVKGVVMNARDVTERIESEMLIQESNLRYEAVAEATSDAIYEFDAATKKIYITGSNYSKIFGFGEKDQSLDMSFWISRLHPEEKKRVSEQIASIRPGKPGSHYEIEYRFRRQDETYAHVLDRFSIIWDDGVQVKKIGALQDITTRKFQETILAFEKDIYKLNSSQQSTLKIVLDKVIEFLEKMIPGAICCITELRNNRMIHIAGETLPQDYISSLAIAGLETDMNAFPEYNNFIPDMEKDQIWNKYAPIAHEFDMKSCWSIPIRKTDGIMTAAFVIHYKKQKDPTENEIYLFERAASLVGVLMENRRSGEELKEAINRYEIVAKATSDTIWDWKIQEDNFTWNKGITEMFGYQPEEVMNVSKWWFDRIHPEDSIRVSVKLYNFLEKRVKKWQDEYRFRCADGTYKFVFDRGFLIKDESGKSSRMIGSMQDVTKQKEEEQRLRLMETVITHAKDAVMITDNNISETPIPKIVFVNQAFSEMSGYSAEEVIGKSPIIFNGPNTDKKEYSRLSDFIKNRQETKVETVSYKKNKEQYWVSFSMIPISTKEEEISHWISIQRDITAQKKQEKEKEQLIRELTQNNKDLKQFSYITSHNLRAPLSNLTGLLNLIEDIPIENNDLKLILNGFSKSTHLLNETINDLVKVVIIKDNPSIKKEEVTFSEVFESVFVQLNYLIDQHKPIIKIKLGKDSLPNINKAYLESILLNLLTNAIKYRNLSKKLNITITTKIKRDKILLVFEDNGIGIDMERNKDKIFGLYQRFHNYPDSKGLGLYLVKSQVETMGGTIEAQSEVNKGTKFTLTFNNY